MSTANSEVVFIWYLGYKQPLSLWYSCQVLQSSRLTESRWIYTCIEILLAEKLNQVTNKYCAMWWQTERPSLQPLSAFSCRASLQGHLSQAWKYLIVPIGVYETVPTPFHWPTASHETIQLFHMKKIALFQLKQYECLLSETKGVSLTVLFWDG